MSKVVHFPAHMQFNGSEDIDVMVVEVPRLHRLQEWVWIKAIPMDGDAVQDQVRVMVVRVAYVREQLNIPVEQNEPGA